MSKNKIILGTVQFGLDYGINNRKGRPNPEEVIQIFRHAISNGINTLDTADAYGHATDLIGNFHRVECGKFHVITKFKGYDSEVSLTRWVHDTLIQLNINSLHACMFHSVEDYLTKPHLMKILQKLNKEKLIDNIGVSVYTNEQFECAIYDSQINVIQLPFNLLDNQNLRGTLISKAKNEGKTIHVRSVFLQGLFFMNLDSLPAKFNPLRDNLIRLHNLCNDLEVTMQSLALGYVHQNPNIDGVLIGIDNLSQLKSNLESLSVNLSQTAIDEVNNILVTNKDLLNPINW